MVQLFLCFLENLQKNYLCDNFDKALKYIIRNVYKCISILI